jgi:Heparinase II/III N-terminus/Heparinase II/III-like protein
MSRLGCHVCGAVHIFPAKMAWQLRDRAVRATWPLRRVIRHQLPRAAVMAPACELSFTAVLPADTAARVPQDAREAVLEAADRLLEAGDIEQVWQPSHLQQVTLLATAWFLTHDERYAQRVAGNLRSCWRENPFDSGTHWTRGIEVAIRLSNLAWIRRLLNDWSGVADLFERNGLALRQIRCNQQYLAALRSRGSSASNYLIAEAAGQLVVSCAFPWFRESERWRRKSAVLLERELGRNTFASGIGQQPASDYQCAIIELCLVAAVEADVSGHPLRPATWAQLCALADSAAALLDERLRPPHSGDSGEVRELMLGALASNCWPSMLALAKALVGPQDWWPQPPADAIGLIVGALAGSMRKIEGRPSQRPSHFAEAGITLLRTRGKNEIWCRCEGDPDGNRSADPCVQADALSVEVRYAGVDILADTGTLCHRGKRAWHSGESASFRRARHTHSREIEVLDDGDVASWTAEHYEYASSAPSALHRRSVLLDRASRSIDIVDQIEGGTYGIGLAFYLGPKVHARLEEESCAVLDWPTGSTSKTARLELPLGLRWSVHPAETDPVPGEYFHDLRRHVPPVVLLGRGRCVPGMPLITRLKFLDSGKPERTAVSRIALSWIASALSDIQREIRAEAK